MPTFRDATADDHPLFATFFAQLGVDDPTPAAGVFAARIAPRTLFLEEEGVAQAYAFTTPLDGTTAHVRHLVVLDGARGRGLGRTLLLEVARRLRAQGLTRWRLNVKVDNAPARALYARVGMVELLRSVALWWPWARLPALPAPIEGTTIEAPSEAVLAEAELALGLMPGTCAAARVAGDHLRIARRAGRVVGLARFDPAFPGCYPFRAEDGAVARALLESLAPLRRPADDRVAIVAEGQSTLAAALLEAGAIERFRILLLEGALP